MKGSESRKLLRASEREFVLPTWRAQRAGRAQRAESFGREFVLPIGRAQRAEESFSRALEGSLFYLYEGF